MNSFLTRKVTSMTGSIASQKPERSKHALKRTTNGKHTDTHACVALQWSFFFILLQFRTAQNASPTSPTTHYNRLMSQKL